MGKMQVLGQVRQAMRDFNRGIAVLKNTDDVGKVALVLNELIPQLDGLIPGARVKIADLVVKNARKDYKREYLQ